MYLWLRIKKKKKKSWEVVEMISMTENNCILKPSALPSGFLLPKLFYLQYMFVYLCSFHDIGSSCFFQMKTHTHTNNFSSWPKLLQDILISCRETTDFHLLTVQVLSLCISLKLFEAMWEPLNLANLWLCLLLATTLIHFLLRDYWLFQQWKQQALPLCV